MSTLGKFSQETSKYLSVNHTEEYKQNFRNQGQAVRFYSEAQKHYFISENLSTWPETLVVNGGDCFVVTDWRK